MSDNQCTNVITSRYHGQNSDMIEKRTMKKRVLILKKINNKTKKHKQVPKTPVSQSHSTTCQLPDLQSNHADVIIQSQIEPRLQQLSNSELPGSKIKSLREDLVKVLLTN